MSQLYPLSAVTIAHAANDKQTTPTDASAMVRKSSHRGVHSGNTLRASNSRYSRRYFHQSCIISRVGRDVLKKLLGAENTTTDSTARLPSSDAPKADDKIGHPQNIPIDVALSLNKQARWLLPSVLKHDISSSSFADPDLMVSLLERHKLKRHANCVSYCSNAGAIKKIEPYRGHYFSFAHPLPNGISRRAMKREVREQTQKKVSDRRIKHVFTANGPVDQNIGDSELRYEVFYPCPQQSSLSHNPKYIKQRESAPPGDKGEKPENGKPRRKHRCKQRKGFTLKDFDYDEVCASKDFDNDFENEDLWTSDSAVRQPADTKELFLDILIDKAERAKQHLFENKRRQKKKNEPREVQDTKPHLHYISSSHIHNTVKPKQASNCKLFKPIAAESTRVIFPSADVSVSTLAECFGERYYEAACRPRKFLLDITSHVRDLQMKKGIYPSVADSNEKFLTFLVFTFDGFYDNGLDVYKVSLNCQLRPGLIAIQEEASQQMLDVSTTESVISQAMNVVETCVMERKKNGAFPLFCQTPPGLFGKCVKQHLGDAHSYFPSLQQVFQRGSKVTDPYIPSLEDNIDEDPAFCDICYEEVSFLVMGGAPATALVKCGHRVCDACWSLHVQTRIQQGFVRITCPGYDCQEEVDVGVLLSVVPVDVVSKVVQRQEEMRIGASQTEKWCPNEGCGRVLRFIPKYSSDQLDEKVLQQDVVCACGCHVCFMCLSAPHWPASCQQAKSYREALAAGTFRSHNEHDDEKDSKGTIQNEPNGEKMVIVKGKLCPGCRHFVEKNGGCNLVYCRCGLSFCFYCLKTDQTHHGFSNCIDKQAEDKLTTTVAVHHFNRHLAERTDKKQEQTSRHRSRVSLTGRAAEFRSHRLTSKLDTPTLISVAKAVAIAAHKNQTISELVLQACRSSSEDTISPVPQDFRSTDIHFSSLSVTVRTFLKNVEQSKQEILEVVEYTLVFARDGQDSILRRRALRIAEDLGTFCSFTQSIMDSFCKGPADAGRQDMVKAVLRLGEIQHWTQVTLASLIKTIRSIRTEAGV